MDVRKPMIVGFLGLIASHLLLISVPPRSYGLLLLALAVPFGWVPLVAAVVVGDMGISLAVTTNALRLARVKA